MNFFLLFYYNKFYIFYILDFDLEEIGIILICNEFMLIDG